MSGNNISIFNKPIREYDDILETVPISIPVDDMVYNQITKKCMLFLVIQILFQL